MYFGGVEGGATHSNLVICDETGKVVGRTKGPGTNHWTLGIEECAKRIIDMIHLAKEDANIPRDRPLDSLGLTLSGCEQESSNSELAARVKDMDDNAAKAIYVASDTAGSLFTGAPNGGMVLIAGTGSNALLRTADGQQHGCGGWGYLLGDEGGAYWIAHKAVKTVFDDVDGLLPSPHPTDRVWEVIREHFDADTRADLLPHAYKHFDKSMFAGVTAKLSALAYKGDALSRHIFSVAGSALASHAAALAVRSDAPRLRVVCVGSVWKSWDILKPGVLKQLRDRKDGSIHTGFVEDVDLKSDLATLRIPVNGLPVMKLGSSSDIKPGEWVVAMGSPLALSNTVTAGVVSSTQRASEELGLRGKDMVYIQTDAPITFGNSGGPLVNLDGEAIGINSMKVTSGISFAIPIDYVKDFLAKKHSSGTTKAPQVSRRYLGITMLSLTPNILMELRMRNPEMPTDLEHGILVWKVIIGSPAYNGGLQPGDIVISINSKPVRTATDIYTLLENTTGSLGVEIVRGHQRLMLTITPEIH